MIKEACELRHPPSTNKDNDEAEAMTKYPSTPILPHISSDLQLSRAPRKRPRHADPTIA